MIVFLIGICFTCFAFIFSVVGHTVRCIRFSSTVAYLHLPARRETSLEKQRQGWVLLLDLPTNPPPFEPFLENRFEPWLHHLDFRTAHTTLFVRDGRVRALDALDRAFEGVVEVATADTARGHFLRRVLRGFGDLLVIRAAHCEGRTLSTAGGTAVSVGMDRGRIQP